jgi:S-adenosyl-L-methionine hydrolase (adenosine-forming)
MSAPAQITFLTDYGLEHKFIGVCRGVMQRITPGVPILDITHLVPPGDVRHGAVVLAQSVPYLPTAVHLAVVDPGVGTSRKAVAVVAGENVFIGPDNGLLMWAADALGGPVAAYEIADPQIRLKPTSNTFHGRDLFAPAAAHVAGGRPPATLGDLVRLSDPLAEITADGATGEVLTVDRFGNIQTSLEVEKLQSSGIDGELEITVAGTTTRLPFVPTFGSVPAGTLLAHEDSAQLLSIAINLGDAATQLGLTPGTRFSLRRVAAS